MIETYAEYGAIGVIVSLFVMLIMNLIKSQKEQSKDLDSIRQTNAKSQTKMSNVEGIVLKMLDRWNRSDDSRDRRHEDLSKELAELSDKISYLSGKINAK
jgi:predicted  nucleic acid-binding Zn-ribbon protein|tara:strand:+ start:324 stop:623 length:300 start_codon:yes stop_codon:yes gene_type:complete